MKCKTAKHMLSSSPIKGFCYQNFAIQHELADLDPLKDIGHSYTLQVTYSCDLIAWK